MAENILENKLLVEKWAPVLDHKGFDQIGDIHRRATTATILENTEKALKEDPQSASMTTLFETTNASGDNGFTSAAAASGPRAGFDPVLISLVRRSMPNLIAYDIAGVQAMTAPSSLIFALRAQYANNPANTATWTDAFYNEANTAYAGAGTHSGATGAASLSTGTGMSTGTLETLGTPGNEFAEMGFSIEKVTATAEGHGLKAEFTTELQQDLKAVHGLDAQAELANILSSEIIAEMNRKLVRAIYTTAVPGAANTATPGVFDLDVDANGRWMAEKFKGLMFQIDIESAAVAKGTRRGRGNIIICSSEVASALQMAGVLDYSPAMQNNLAVDDTGNTFAGILNKRYKVYIDPYAGANYLVVGYKGASAFDAGIFYCPYVPLQMFKAQGENTFQPKIAFKSRYAMVANPFAEGTTQGGGALNPNTNQYYRRVLVNNLI